MEPSYLLSAAEQAARVAAGEKHFIVGYWPASDERHAPRAVCACGAEGPQVEHPDGGSASPTEPTCCGGRS